MKRNKKPGTKPYRRYSRKPYKPTNSQEQALSVLRERITLDGPEIAQITDNLYIGGVVDRWPLPPQIRHIVSLYPWQSYKWHKDVRSSVQVPMADALGEIDEATVNRLARWVNEVRKDGPVLVHCGAGINRSALVAARALILAGMEPEDAVALIRRKRGQIALSNPHFRDWILTGRQPTPGWQKTLDEEYAELAGVVRDKRATGLGGSGLARSA